MMNESPIAGQQGAVDLSGMLGAQGVPPEAAQQSTLSPQPSAVPPAGMPQGMAAGPTVRAPLIRDVDERNFEEVMALSQTVPVVLVLYAPKSLASTNAVAVLEEVAREDAGAFQLGRVDVDANPTLASAFQTEAVPAGFAVVGRRPVPLFEGVPTKIQMQQVLGELFEVSAQVGVTGRLEVSEEDLERPIPEAHIPARTAEEEGDWDSAIAAWKKVLANNPGDQEAKTALVRCQFQARQEREAEVESDSPAVVIAQQADLLFARGQEERAFDLLLNAMEESSDPEEKEQLRVRLVELFQIAADSAAVKSARSRLATMLMV